jgi:peptidoglycan/LPS O-acetylase OafA/YrhL
MRDTPQTGVAMARAGYQPALDGLRAVSISLVVGAHLAVTGIVPGAFGVTLFFFISGYLITGQLLKTVDEAGRIDFAGFYLRRALRLMPAGITYTVVAGLAFQAAGGRVPFATWAAALFYAANYADIWRWFRSNLAGVRHPFNVLWSLAVEEHYYALWPAALAWLRRRAIAVAVLVAMCALLLVWRCFLLHACFAPGEGAPPGYCGPAQANAVHHYDRIYFGTDTRLDSIAYGALMALLEGRIVLASGWRAVAGAGLLALSFAWQGATGRESFRYTLQGLALLGLVPWLLQRTSWPYRFLCLKPALLLGRLSYSLYLWHWAALGAADVLAPSRRLVWLAIAVPLSFALAAASYWGIERPMLRLRRRAGSHAA